MSISEQFLQRVKQEMKNLDQLETIPVGISDLALMDALGSRFKVPTESLDILKRERQQQIDSASAIYPAVSFPVRGIYVFRGAPMSCYHNKDDLILFEGPELVSFKREYAIDMFGSCDMWDFSKTARSGSANIFPAWESRRVLTPDETYSHAETVLNALDRVDAGMSWFKGFYKNGQGDFGFTWFHK
ncbi:hypothetical protein KA107_03425 [Candidatus Pacearchaeota archaeon]|nr:hypothetical protein [Candidatus Pacearchaeota archaeon]